MIESTATTDFGFGPEEEMLREQARKLLDEVASPLRRRALLGGDPEAVYARGERPAFDEDAWRRCRELGWTALAVPEDHGGIGSKAVGVVALAEEVGRHAFPSPLLPTLIATYVLRAAGGAAAGRWLRRIAEGTTMTLAATGGRGSWELDATEVIARDVTGSMRLDGRAFFVQDPFKVDAFLVAARTGDGICIAAVPKSAPGLSLVQDHIVDLTRDQGHLTLRDVRVEAGHIVAPAPHGLDVLRRAWPSALTLVSADLVGASEWLLQTTVEYAKVRKQFDRPLGFFQAVKHPLVDAMMAIDRARSLLYDAAGELDTDSVRADVAARMTKSAASDAASFMSGRAVQLHGGIGFTWECDVHFFFKRNRHNQALYGDGVHHRRKLADLLIGPIPGVP